MAIITPEPLSDELTRVVQFPEWKDRPIYFSWNGAPKICNFCKQEGHIAKDCPELANMECNDCHQKGHTFRLCPENSPKKIADAQAIAAQEAQQHNNNENNNNNSENNENNENNNQNEEDNNQNDQDNNHNTDGEDEGEQGEESEGADSEYENDADSEGEGASIPKPKAFSNQHHDEAEGAMDLDEKEQSAKNNDSDIDMDRAGEPDQGASKNKKAKIAAPQVEGSHTDFGSLDMHLGAKESAWTKFCGQVIREANAPVSITLPTDRHRPPQQSFTGASVPIRLDASLTRDHPQIEQLIGFFVNTLALRVDISGEPNKIIEIVQPPRRTDQTPLFQVLFAWQNNDSGCLQLDDVEAVPERVHYKISKFDLELSLNERNGEIVGSLQYSTALFDRQTIDRYIGYLEAMLRWMTVDTAQSIGQAQILGAPEQELLLQTWNRTERSYPENSCIHHLFEDKVKAMPEAVAIMDGDRTMTYRELNHRANVIAHQLVAAGVKRGDYVLIMLDRSIELVAAEIAILKVGAAYVPIDTKAPEERQSYIATDCGAKLLITDENTDVPVQIQTPLLRLSGARDDIENEKDMVETSAFSSASSLDAAYVMYTSGSTGRPKGVMVPHRNVARLIINNGFSDIGPNDRVAFASNVSFDLSTLDVWSALLNGSCVVIIDYDTNLDAHRLAEALDRYQVTFLQLATALFHQYAFIIGPALSKLRYLMCGGEQGNVEVFDALLKHGGPQHLINGYGPTEATTYATTYEVLKADNKLERLPIGRPIGNTWTYVLDKYCNPVPIGVVGELYIGGPGVAIGYLNRPDLTAERFIPDTFRNVPGARMYRTGDLVRYLPDGNIVFMGRNDDQVKIRGFRIELGEIEARLAEHPQVREVIVLAIGESDKRLIAYIVADPDEQLANTLREYLAATLPEYMIPSAFVRLDVFPLTNNGKVDRRALPEPDSTSFATFEYVAPQGEMEIALAAIWTDLLKIDKIGRYDNFFTLGGYSLLAVQMIARVRSLGHSLSVHTLFENPVLNVLATSLSRYQEAPEAPSNIITPCTTRITPEMLPLIDLNQYDIDRIVEQVPGGVANIQDIYGLSPLQDGILFHHMMATEVFDSRGTLDSYLAAYQNVVDRHDILRTAIMWDNLSSPAQVVLRKAALSITELSLNPVNVPILDQVTELCDPRQHRIELSQAPLVRFSIVQDTNGRWILAQQMHHLIGDHSTLDVMAEEIQAYMDRRSESLPVPQPFRNLIAQVRPGVSVDEHERFFRKMLGDFDTPSLPYGLSDIYNDGCGVTQSRRMLPQDLNNTLRGHAKRLGVSLASLCHLAWAQVIAATSGQRQVVFGTVLSGRMQGGSGSERAMGLFVNTLPIRVDVEGSSALDAVRRVHTNLAALLEHEHASLSLAQRCSSVPYGVPLLSTLLNYRHNFAPSTPSAQAKINSGFKYLGGEERTNYPFTLSVDDFGSRLGVTAQVLQPYDPSSFCGYMQQALQNLASALENNPETPVQSLGVLPAEEYDMIVHSWNNTETPFPIDRCIHQLFEEQVRKAPEAIAVVHDDHSMTYSALNNRANSLARTLVDFGVLPGDNVAILLERSFKLIVAQLAILKVGGAYVPIDAKAPVERQTYIATDSGAKLLITDENTDVLPHIQTPLLRLSGAQDNIENEQDTVEISVYSSASSLDAAYIMYTSGSTGIPKGVVVSHRGIVRLVVNSGYADIGLEDRVAFVANIAFDASTFDVWLALLNGARIVIIDNDTYLDAYLLEAALDRHQITALLLTMALFHQYAFTIGNALSKLKYLICGGEQGLIEVFSEVLRHGGPVRLINAYGPTESTVIATTYNVTGGNNVSDRLPIGRPIGNTQVYVLDKYCNPVPIGVVGELYIGGPGVAIGYLNRPDPTAERFIPDPFRNVPGARMYRTGDLVRYLPDGNIVFMGRNDDQVKIRGFRIELGEIEARFAEHPQVREVIVLAIGESDKRLIAYVVADLDEQLANTLREHLAAALPEYMIPSAFVRLDVFPLTNNGKVDRRALPEPDSASFAARDYEVPQGDLEVTLASIWAELLKIEQVGRHDNFFMLGGHCGHSLLAVRMMSYVRKRLGIELKLQTLFSAPTITKLAKKLLQGNNGQEDEYGVLLPLKTQGSRPPLFCIHPGLGMSWSYGGLAKYLNSEQPLYGLQARGLNGKTPMAISVKEMTLDYIGQIRSIQPHGPYYLLGWSFGGTVAQSMAVEFERQGEKVALLAIMDSTGDYSIFDGIQSQGQEQDANHYAVRLAESRSKDSIERGLELWEKTKPVVINNQKLARRFTPSVYGGDILFFRASVRWSENAPLVDPASWTPYIRGKIEVHDVACQHLEMDTLESIALIGGIVAARIDELER
ncbi:hypothetical protein BGZ83_000149 [Gryganskiella cystojenkinii]|nr:hypothetical protein BGZ83_000149 [Gryganskiella cystojenkinii]